MFLIHHDQGEPGQRCEYGGARADQDAGLAAMRGSPSVASCGAGERGMQNRNTCAEAPTEPLDQLRRERDLRHQHQRLAAAGYRCSNYPQIHLGLAATGYTVEKMCGEPAQRSSDCVDDQPLLVRQRHFTGAQLEPRRFRRNADRAGPSTCRQRLQMRELERGGDIIRCCATAFCQPQHQGALPRRAPRGWRLQFPSARIAQGPGFNDIVRRLAGTQGDRQCCGDDLAEWMVVVVGRPAQQFEGHWIEHRLLIHDVQGRFELCGRDPGTLSNADQYADQLPTAEWHAYPYARFGRLAGCVDRR